jgi:hypothetical protein
MTTHDPSSSQNFISATGKVYDNDEEFNQPSTITNRQKVGKERRRRQVENRAIKEEKGKR